MARRLTLEGAEVQAVAEVMPYSGGLKRNIVQCLEDYGIPLKLSHTVIDIRGKDRVEGVTISRVDDNRRPIPGTEEYYPCDTLLLSVGLIPENELSEKAGVKLNPATRGPVVNESLETSIPGIFACGNVLHVHDLVDYVSDEAAAAGRWAARFIAAHAAASSDTSNHLSAPVSAPVQTADTENAVSVISSDGIRYTVPSIIHPGRIEKSLTVRFRVDSVYHNSSAAVYFDSEKIKQKKKRIFAPGEMEELKITEDDLKSCPGLKTITLRIEKEQ